MRSPKRPNAIGLSVVKRLGIENNNIQIEEIDVIDGTPLLDIKLYVPAIRCACYDVDWLVCNTGSQCVHRTDWRTHTIGSIIV